jgi:hypothetical protein
MEIFLEAVFPDDMEIFLEAGSPEDCKSNSWKLHSQKTA